jgi:hypothetical protein
MTQQDAYYESHKILYFKTLSLCKKEERTEASLPGNSNTVQLTAACTDTEKKLRQDAILLRRALGRRPF